MTEEQSNNNHDRDVIKKKLAIQTGLPLSPTPAKQIVRDFDDDVIILDHYPLKEINTLKIGDKCICLNELVVDEEAGLIYLPQNYTGLLFLTYTYCIPEEAYDVIIDMIMDYDAEPGWDKHASSISEGGVTVSLDTSTGQWSQIQSLIDDLKNTYNCTARLI